eukprot:TRINITY_DN25218_c0_g1_i1.p1 TRINITY_DN25218_c0_g1~~TRINITY_DN25218_c0_g1_i1.p1  ORF type:complete len:116 (+),score=55.33 TRINITY_DN25218_c0_g1_i1:38-385(+)
MIRRPQRSTQSRSSAASDVYKRQVKKTVQAVKPQRTPRGGMKRSQGAHHHPHKELSWDENIALAKEAFKAWWLQKRRLASRCLITSRGSMQYLVCLLYTSPSPRDRTRSRMPSSA